MVPIIIVVAVAIALLAWSRAQGGVFMGSISPNFSWSEFRSPLTRGGPRVIDVPPELRANTMRLVAALELLRAELAHRVGAVVALRVISGYRTPEYNRAIGGASRSRHMTGEAADVQAYIIATGAPVSPGTVQSAAFALQAQGSIGGVGSYPTFTHVDVGPRRSWGEAGE